MGIIIYHWKRERIIILLFIKKLFNSFKLPILNRKKSKKTSEKSSKVYALERLKEIHNYDYSTFVAKYYRDKDYVVWEYSKEKNLTNHALNLVMKRGKDILLIDCRGDINEIRLEEILEFEEIGTEFVAQYEIFKNYNIIYLYICAEEKFSKKALEHIADNSHFSYEILKEFDV